MKPEQTFLEFQNEFNEWQTVTFPGQPVSGKINHLRREVEELAANPTDGEEMADCFMLLIGIAHAQGVDLLAEAKRKLAKNKLRNWGSIDAQGVISHLK